MMPFAFFHPCGFLACSSHQDSVLRRCCCTWVHHKDYKYPLFYWCVQSGPCFILMQFFISIMHAGCLFSCSKLNNVWFNIRSGFCEMLKPGFVNVFLWEGRRHTMKLFSGGGGSSAGGDLTTCQVQRRSMLLQMQILYCFKHVLSKKYQYFWQPL